MGQQIPWKDHHKQYIINEWTDEWKLKPWLIN